MNIFAFRVFDFRDRFPMPFATIIEALEAIYSNTAYLPEDFSEFVAYANDGRRIVIPSSLYTDESPRFGSTEDARKWVLDRQHQREQEKRVPGTAFVNPNDAIYTQVERALQWLEKSLVTNKPLLELASDIELWLKERGAIPSQSASPLNLTDREKEVLIHLINTELDGICGDRGYSELSALRKKIEEAGAQ